VSRPQTGIQGIVEVDERSLSSDRSGSESPAAMRKSPNKLDIAHFSEVLHCMFLIVTLIYTVYRNMKLKVPCQQKVKMLKVRKRVRQINVKRAQMGRIQM
jgi:hypothetical protein